MREVKPTFLCITLALALGYFAYELSAGADTGTRILVVLGAFVAVVFFGPEKTVYTRTSG